jgi:hypothetical protein
MPIHGVPCSLLEKTCSRKIGRGIRCPEGHEALFICDDTKGATDKQDIDNKKIVK